MMKNVILFADNERGIRQFVKQELEAEGYDVVLTEDGTDTLEILGRFVVDAVILDEHMPRCCGLDAAKYIKRQHPDLPIILFTADDYYEQYKSPSIDAAVIKSEDLGMLKETISKLLNPGKNTALATHTMLPSSLMHVEVECGR